MAPVQVPAMQQTKQTLRPLRRPPALADPMPWAVANAVITIVSISAPPTAPADANTGSPPARARAGRLRRKSSW